MNDDPVLTEDDRLQEELVAYLDGELDAEASARLERRLTEDQAYRLRLRELQSAWDLLDVLPRAHVTESFTQSTVEMVALSAAAEVVEKEAVTKRRHVFVMAAAAASLLIAGLLGYVVVSNRLDRPNQQLVRDLPVIENIDRYRVAESLDFLRQLDRSGLFDEEPTDAP